VTKSKKDKTGELSPLDEDLAKAASEAERPLPEPSPDEVAAGAMFGDETGEGAESPAPAGETNVEAGRLKKELDELQSQADEYLDGWQRARAEFANYKKRMEREQEEARSRAAASVIATFLPIVDDLARALRDRPEPQDFDPWIEGIDLIYRKMSALIEAEGVTTIEAEGQTFDPQLHEAVTYEANDGYSEGQIIEVIQQGYRLGDRILRPARVRVAK
jgi:molecular chaperone GrpE